jgi:hypothetical protein
MICSDCDHFFSDFCGLYERSVDSFDSCDDFVSMESSLWAWEDEVEQEDDGFPD